MILSEWLDWMTVMGYISITLFIMYRVLMAK